VLVVGDVAGVLGVSSEAIDEACAGARVARTALRAEALRLLRADPPALMIAAPSAGFLLSEDFLAAFTARASGLALLVATRRPDPDALLRLRGTGVRAEHLVGPIDRPALRRRVQGLLQQPPGGPAARTGAVKPRGAGDGRLETTRIPTQAGDQNMANISKSLEEVMKIDGAFAAALADWESGLCLGALGGGARLNVEVAAAGNCQVVKAKMATMNELGIKGAIQDILITLDDQIHLIRPLRHGENLFLYVAIDKAKGNLGLARHRLQKIESELNI
jgi:hypothetical protein